MDKHSCKNRNRKPAVLENNEYELQTIEEERVDPQGAKPEYLHELFNINATWTENGRVGGMYAYNVKRMLQELDMIEGVPVHRLDSYIKEHMLRGDQDKDGMLSLSEFLLWFLTEVSAYLPFNCVGGNSTTAPLYNRFVHYMLADCGAGVRRKASGLLMGQFTRMCLECQLTSDEHIARNAAQVASRVAASDRVLGKMESGTRLQFAQLVHALQYLSDKRHIGVDSVLYRIVSFGKVPPIINSKNVNKAYRLVTLENVRDLLIESELEQPLLWTSYECDICGESHSRWVVGNVDNMREYLYACGAHFLPQFRIVNTRNVRAVFHRYNSKLNKGILPPKNHTFEKDTQCREDVATTDVDNEAAGAPSISALRADSTDYDIQEKELSKAQEDLKKAAAEEEEMYRHHVLGPDIWSSAHQAELCCCQYRSLGTMEMQTFWKVCLDNKTIRHSMENDKGLLNSHRLEAAFMTACSIGGVYCKDTSCGIHDAAVSPQDVQNLKASRSSNLPSAGGLRNGVYGTPFEAGNVLLASYQGRRPSANALSPRSARYVASSTSGTPWMGGLPRGAPTPVSLRVRPESGSPASERVLHRQPVPTLTFPQFLEAIRLVAEDIIGHPQVLVSVEMTLWSIFHDMVDIGCPLHGENLDAYYLDKRGTSRAIAEGRRGRRNKSL
ncbi:hypothetical protein CEUSTIGMA_g3601.t1 [Chlamydomonas eustigma]|uniref:EF-hand domain-containing protein n=1 Tax=Chlamydomonas eustigma TaxID=1157962 RepID=A0A250WZ90_9CHLO|nr:hypothetical protein CEUSTIGMA_g3601.t1 [Chlamydomonas eustigma]|eukprot:GAX76157.1 hypothetical protein CEUSTIGMA_g3601.t1 [Chlamydomonas eustigma]